MRYERIKELTAVLSVVSVGITVWVATVGDFTFQSELFPVIVGVAGVIAGFAAFTSIVWSRRLERARSMKHVFLIYAREDLKEARRIALFLRERGFKPWLDVDEIAPGEIWKKSVIRALEESAVALVLVSEHLDKAGFVQEELTAALATLQERHRDVSPVIPVRLTDTSVPTALGDVQWVNLFEPDGLERLEAGLSKVAGVGA